ncbi:hypothetical protein H5410_015681 [Solanum commersonii]|uniref:Uncharacterized protein n=1 Tax=Solanum commersonii TaxID=4109 RepID=A0A9J5ZUE8_SOLCO|nr:hypothetical protein H5410_015681 [Solanum commersonii]
MVQLTIRNDTQTYGRYATTVETKDELHEVQVVDECKASESKEKFKIFELVRISGCTATFIFR